MSNAARIMSLFQGQQRTAILKTALELNAFEALADGPATASSVAARLKTSERGTRVLLDALAALELIHVQGDEYLLTQAAADHLVPGGPAYLGDLRHIFGSEQIAEGLKTLPDAVRHGGTVLDSHAETPGHGFWEDFARYSTASAGPGGAALAKVLADWAAARSPLDVLDVACGTGLYGYSLAARQPRARVWSLDWPNVLAISRGHAERLGVIDRVHFIEGDMFRAPLGGPYDLIIASHVFHHFSEQHCRELMERLAAVLRPDGRLAIHDFIPTGRPEGTEAFPYLFSVTMLMWTREGESHNLSRYQRLLTTCGFALPEVHRPAGLESRFLIAERPSAAS